MPDAQTFDDSGNRVRTLKQLGIGAALVALVIVAVGISVRSSAKRDLSTVAAEASIPTVVTVMPDGSVAKGSLLLPGNVQAYNSAAIYARTNGYVRRWLADIGDRVRPGQTLAILDAPEIDQQLAQAEADYQTALANQRLAQTTATRWTGLLLQDAVSRQESDEKAGDLAARTAVANAELANVKRLRAMQGFTRLTAPFGGVVTSRSAQIGALIVSGNAASQPLFTVSDVHRVRIYVRVPQIYSAQLHPGLQVPMTLPEFPGRTFDTVLTRNAGAVDARSGAILVELQTDNTDGALKPGAYSQVNLPVASGTGVRVPASTIIFRDEGPSVAIVDQSGHVTLKTVMIGRDEGTLVEITSGLTGKERIIDTPPDAIESGDRVLVKAAPKAEGAKNARS